MLVPLLRRATKEESEGDRVGNESVKKASPKVSGPEMD